MIPGSQQLDLRHSAYRTHGYGSGQGRAKAASYSDMLLQRGNGSLLWCTVSSKVGQVGCKNAVG